MIDIIKNMSKSKHDWISVEDGFPESGTLVLVFDNRFFVDTDGIGIATFIQFPTEPGWRVGGRVWTFLNPSHWAELPKKPL